MAQDNSKPQVVVAVSPAPVVTQEAPPPAVAVKLDDQQRMVKVRPRQTIPRTKVGDVWYHFSAGKETLVPKYVATLLEEKGII